MKIYKVKQTDHPTHKIWEYVVKEDGGILADTILKFGNYGSGIELEKNNEYDRNSTILALPDLGMYAIQYMVSKLPNITWHVEIGLEALDFWIRFNMYKIINNKLEKFVIQTQFIEYSTSLERLELNLEWVIESLEVQIARIVLRNN